MTQLTAFVRIKLIAFAVLAFSVYYLLYFYSFSQGMSIDSGTEINTIKVLSILCLVGAFFTCRIRLSSFDLLYLLFVVLSAVSYVISGIVYGFNDTLFLNYLVFSLCYPFLVSKEAEQKIFFSYKVICFIVMVQVFIDMFLNLVQVTLWDGGLYVGGLGNPTSFGFVCTFCLAYVNLGSAGFSERAKILLTIIYMFAVLNTGALSPIFLSVVILIVTFLKKGNFLRKFILVSLALGSLLFFLFIAKIEGGFLVNKVNALLYYIGLSDFEAGSISVSVRAENMSLAIRFLQDAGTQLFFGHYQGLTYYPIDSQYITLLLSFGLVVFLYFIFFNLIAVCKIGLNKKYEKRGFIFLGLLLFFLIFINNRVLDYFPLGYIFVSLIALTSRGNEVIMRRI